MIIYVDVVKGTWGDARDLKIVSVSREVLNDKTFTDSDFMLIAQRMGRSVA